MSYTAKVKSSTQVEIREARTGHYVCTCSITQGKAVSAVASGDEVCVTLHNGKVEVHDAKTGRYIQTS